MSHTNRRDFKRGIMRNIYNEFYKVLLNFKEVAQEVWNDGAEWNYPADGSCNLSMCNGK